jgi:hypothetical protein
MIHDFNYWIGCTEKDREKADLQFYEAMRKDAGWWPHYQALALAYYLAVRMFGGACFYYGEHERDEKDLDEALAKIRDGEGKDSGVSLPNGDSDGGDGEPCGP